MTQEDVISLASDHNNAQSAHLVPKDGGQKKSYSNLTQIWYTFTSTICTISFLSVLMVLALTSRLKWWLSNRNRSDAEHVYHSTQELKLVPDLNYYYQFLDLDIKRYEILTKDGFVLNMNRIINPKESVDERKRRKPILLLHGLLQSSGSFCSGGKQSLGYYLFENGYDVWLGNNRCGFEPRHTFLDPNDFKMWDWDIVDMAQYDLPAMIDHVLANCDSPATNLSLICHSQGTTQGFISLDSDRFGISKKINSFIALSPAVYGGSLLEEKSFIKIIAQMSLKNYFFGIKSFLPIMMKMRNLLVSTKLFGFLSYIMFNYLFDWTDELWDNDIKYRHFLFSPVYVSVKLMSWWLNDKNGFKSSKAILEHNKQWFDSNTPAIFLVVPLKDKLVDGAMLVKHMIEIESTNKFDLIYLEKYSHLDVLWSKTVIDDIGVPILSFLKKLNN
ncbi:Sterol esterase 1 [Wickerhamomyces ciferrii]|uniref:Sterol esterase 1 n=1 Tax=Wickerhamomyces ciferrii (strain ATCC 14091 / BCRC 22168 / CBS 111 / JCM 3599 / NBRC 0793 / NRRL Y-1031 F-60-10) TaxID=1206466 RepID=K0KNU7_WICCF|nr:Sterol esterase 1 [Wickerhamomyces ciferrii]CCH44656.1 Sterol esterase 1 [Wickerhamomyces ciferrii]